MRGRGIALPFAASPGILAIVHGREFRKKGSRATNVGGGLRGSYGCRHAITVKANPLRESHSVQKTCTVPLTSFLTRNRRSLAAHIYSCAVSYAQTIPTVQVSSPDHQPLPTPEQGTANTHFTCRYPGLERSISPTNRMQSPRPS